LRALALAEAHLMRASEHVVLARGVIQTASNTSRDAMTGIQRAHELEWHRNWMVGLQRDLARARQVEEERRMDVQAATAAAMKARRAVRALERLKERAWRAHDVLARREDQKALDLLGGLRYAARQRRTGEDQ
jgi:flagellar biosynthesis chaperone FliJ